MLIALSVTVKAAPEPVRVSKDIQAEAVSAHVGSKEVESSQLAETKQPVNMLVWQGGSREGIGLQFGLRRAR